LAERARFELVTLKRIVVEPSGDVLRGRQIGRCCAKFDGTPASSQAYMNRPRQGCGRDEAPASRAAARTPTTAVSKSIGHAYVNALVASQRAGRGTARPSGTGRRRSVRRLLGRVLLLLREIRCARASRAAGVAVHPHCWRSTAGG
jgi:hypothetical protein